MARMLQALKNLEARSPRRTPGNVLVHLQEPAAKEAPPAAPEKEAKPLPVFVQAPAVIVELPPHQEHEQPPAAARSGASRNLSTLERNIRRALVDPIRAQPLEQLAAHLNRDLEQTGSKSVLWTAVGATSGMHETLLHVAAILTGQNTGKVLLVDADLARRALSTAVDYGQQPGLADLLSSGGLRTRCLPTGFERLSILPAGLLRQVDLPTIAAQLEELLAQLADEFAVVLICGASTSDTASSTLARIADATYFVVQLGAVEVSEAQAALRDFRAAGARVLGCIAT